MRAQPHREAAMAQEIILASYNRNKAREIEKIMAPIRVTCLADLGVDMDFDAVEDGETYRENASKKVRAAAAHVDGIIVADDSGLEVMALDGRPGVHSARYGGSDIDDAARCHVLLDELENTPGDQRAARFVCVVAVRFPDGTEKFFEGELPGVIDFEPHGNNGFGYDPVMLLPDRGLTVAQIPAEDKNSISHRANAFRLLKDFLVSGEATAGR